MSNSSSSPIQQNSSTNNAKYISIIPENGTEFKSGQKIIFNLDPSLGWIKARDSYLVFDIENVTAKLKLTLRQGGISSIIKNVNIYSKMNGMLLESLQNYNQWTSCEMQYRNDDVTNLTNIEGCPKSIYSKRAFNNDSDLVYHDWQNNYSQVESHRFTQSKDDNTPQNGPVRFCTPLRCGIFRHWDSETLVPILQMGGLRIELELAEALEVVNMPFTGNQASHVCGQNKMGNSLKTQNMAVGNLAADITELMDISETGFLIGQKIQLNDLITNNTNEATITAITQNATTPANGVRVTFTPAIVNAITGGNGEIRISPLDLIQENFEYKIKGAEFRLLQEMPPDNKMKNVDYVFTSYDLFRDSIPSTQTNFNQDITSVASKAVSIFTMYEDAQYDGVNSFPNQHYTQGLTPDETGVNMNSVVYFINNKLYPLRPYNPNRLADKVINQNELVKAFGTLMIPVKNLGCNEHASLDYYTNRYMHARELARGNSVFSLQNAEPQIRVGFSGPRTTDKLNNVIGNVRMNSYVFSKKILHIDGETGLSLEH
tara:strand:- start:1706 stop:3337 length:1632 start_codon:yes stop_codon:yes gene_type:complete